MKLPLSGGCICEAARYDPTWTPKFTFTFLFNYLGIGQKSLALLFQGWVREWFRNKRCAAKAQRKYILQFHSIDIGFQAKSALSPPAAVSSIFSIDYATHSRTILALQSTLKSIF